MKIKVYLLFLIASMPIENTQAQSLSECFSSSSHIGFLKNQVSTASKTEPTPNSSIRTEGLMPNNPESVRSIKLKKQLNLMLNNAIAWKIGIEKDQGLAQAIKYFDSWMSKYKPDYNPINESEFDQLIETYILIKPRLTEENRVFYDKKLKSWADGYIKSISTGGNDGIWVNNWQSIRIKFIALTSVAINDKDMFIKAEALYKKQITNNIDGDGVTVDFKGRDSLHYAIIDLQPLVDTAFIAKKYFGVDLWDWESSQKGSLKKAVYWLIPYVLGQKKHKEFVTSKVPFDVKRRKEGVPGFNGYFDPKYAKFLFWGASQLDSNLNYIATGISDYRPVSLFSCY